MGIKFVNFLLSGMVLAFDNLASLYIPNKDIISHRAYSCIVCYHISILVICTHMLFCL